MTVYVCITAWIALVAFFYLQLSNDSDYTDTTIGSKKKSIPGSVILILLTMGVVVFFIGLRSAGADTEAYITNFKSIPSGWEALFSSSTYENSKEPLFTALGIFCKTINPDYHFYLFTITAISGFCVAIAFRKDSDDYCILMLLFMLSATYGWMINGIRQFMAVSILFACGGFIAKKKWVPFVIATIIMYFIHKSSIIMIPAFFIAQGEAWNKRTLAFMGVGVAAVIFTGEFSSIADSMLEGSGYEGANENAKEFTGSSYIRTIIYAVPVVLAFIKRKEITKKAPAYINVCINMSLVCVACSLIANVTSGVYYGRIPIYFSMYGLVLLPWLINNVYPEYKTLMYMAMFICYIYLFFSSGNMYYKSDLFFDGNVIPKW